MPSQPGQTHCTALTSLSHRTHTYEQAHHNLNHVCSTKGHHRCEGVWQQDHDSRGYAKTERDGAHGTILTLHPTVTWAQRSSKTEAEKNHIFLTIAVVDVDPKKIKLDIQPTSLTFTGYSESKKADYAVKLDFYAEIDPSASKINHSPRAVELVLQKKELAEEYWPRLLKDSKKVHFLKTDFDRVSCDIEEMEGVVY